MAVPVSPDQGCQNVRDNPFKSDLITSIDEVGWGVMVAVSVLVTVGLVGVGVGFGVSEATIGGGVGWLLQFTNSTMINIMITKIIVLAGVIILNEVR